jgi:serine/threonine protein kinase
MDQRFILKILHLTETLELSISVEKIKHLIGLNHPFICKYIDIFQDNINFYIIKQYCPDLDVVEFFLKYKNITHHTFKEMLRQALKGLAYLHSNGIMHTTITPFNILIHSYNPINGDICLKINDYDSFTNVIIDPRFTAAEIFTGEFDSKCDVQYNLLEI